MTHTVTTGKRGTYVFAMCRDCRLYIWDVITAEAVRVLNTVACEPKPPAKVVCISCRGDSSLVPHSHLDLVQL